MLSRTADCIYWISRQIKRAENYARLLDVLYQMSLLPGVLDREALRAPLTISGTEALFLSQGELLTIDNLMRFCTLNPRNPSSIYSCLKTARENAHVVRGSITGEMWETINATWLELRDMNRERQSAQGYRHFLDWVKERSHLFRGVTFGTIRRNQAFNFSRLGSFLERADNTLRILLVQASSVTEGISSWEILLRSLSAMESYREIYRDRMVYEDVAELLLLDVSFPRSLHACVMEASQTLELINGPAGLDTRRICAELLANLRYNHISHVLTSGLVPALINYLATLSSLGSSVQSAYLEGV